MALVIDRITVEAFAAVPGRDHRCEHGRSIALAAAEGLHARPDPRDRYRHLSVKISAAQGFQKPEDVPLSILVPSFVTSELKTAFTIGFLLFIPFVIIDLVVAAVLMSMGMMMVSPVLISLPFKLMLFVLVDGWSLVMGSLAGSFLR
jgi:flagellar biosynthetic protein FliP